MERKDMLFVYNPKAGKAQIKSNLLDIIDIFVKAGYEVTAYPTQAPGDAVGAVASRAEKYPFIVCSGGDGTLDEVVTGMMKGHSSAVLGYVPAGSTNDFANSLKIPRKMKNAAKVVVEGKRYACDVGAFNDDTFVYIAAFGLFTDVSYETRQDMKNVLGHMAYLLEGVKRLSAIRSYWLRVTVDEEVIEDEFLFGMVTNSLSVGGFKRITGRYVELDDGEFEVTLIKKPRNPLEANSIMAALMNRNVNTDYMYCFKAASITVETLDGEALAWTLDGEYGGSHSQAVIKNRKQAVKIMIPDTERPDAG